MSKLRQIDLEDFSAMCGPIRLQFWEMELDQNSTGSRLNRFPSKAVNKMFLSQVNDSKIGYKPVTVVRKDDDKGLWMTGIMACLCQETSSSSFGNFPEG